ncbi:hypothetical protein D1872_298240 [compost metagenome]
MAFQNNLAVKRPQMPLGGNRLGEPFGGVRLIIKLLTLQIAPFHIVPVRQDQTPDAGASQRFGDPGPQRPRSDNQNRGLR